MQQTTKPAPGAVPRQEPRHRTWTPDEFKRFLEGRAQDPKELSQADILGLNAVTSAILQSATKADSLMQLLDLLQPKTSEEPSKIDTILQLLESIASAQIRLESRLGEIERKIVALR